MFSLQDGTGAYWCYDRYHLHRGSSCPVDTVAKRKHIFKLVTNFDDKSVPIDKCAIKFAYDDSFWIQIENKIVSNPTTKSLFVVTKKTPSSDRVLFRMFYDASRSKYLSKVDHEHVAAVISSPCNNWDCEFQVNDLTQAYDMNELLASANQGIRLSCFE